TLQKELHRPRGAQRNYRHLASRLWHRCKLVHLGVLAASRLPATSPERDTWADVCSFVHLLESSAPDVEARRTTQYRRPSMAPAPYSLCHRTPSQARREIAGDGRR